MSQSPDTPRKLPGSLNANRRLDSWLRIEPDGTVTVFPGKVEIGQGILTGAGADRCRGTRRRPCNGSGWRAPTRATAPTKA
jgi:hypothetical protein